MMDDILKIRIDLDEAITYGDIAKANFAPNQILPLRKENKKFIKACKELVRKI